MSRKKKSSSTENVETHTRPLITRKLAYWNEVSEREVGMVEVSEKRSGRLYYAKVLVFGVEWDSFMSWHMTRVERTQVIKTNGTEERRRRKEIIIQESLYISKMNDVFIPLGRSHSTRPERANLSTQWSAFCSAFSDTFDISEITHRSDGFGRHHAHCHWVMMASDEPEKEGKWAILIAFKRDIERQHEADTKQSLNSNSEKFQFSDIHTRVTQAGSRSLSSGMMKQYFH